MTSASAQSVNRLPMPDWSRPGETWRVEPEEWIEPAEGGLCVHRDRLKSSPKRYGPDCLKPSVAVIGRGEGTPICQQHLQQVARAWIEDGQVVSWCLRP